MDGKEIVARLERIALEIGEVPADFLSECSRCPSCDGPVKVENDEHDGPRRISWRCSGCGREGFTLSDARYRKGYLEKTV